MQIVVKEKLQGYEWFLSWDEVGRRASTSAPDMAEHGWNRVERNQNKTKSISCLVLTIPLFLLPRQQTAWVYLEPEALAIPWTLRKRIRNLLEPIQQPNCCHETRVRKERGTDFETQYVEQKVKTTSVALFISISTYYDVMPCQRKVKRSHL